jgi:pyridoxamine 5'-phosphate oxidase
MAKYHELRENYELGELVEANVQTNPIKQFKLWMNDAIKHKQKEPNAMVLSTINEKGAPSSRVVLVKEIDLDGIIFYTNYNSDKALQIHHNPIVALNFNWLDLQRQVRIEGHVEKIDTERSTAYFQSRPKSSQIGAWVSEQSKVIPNREILEESKRKLEEEYKDADVLPKPVDWGGYKVIPDLVEFWQGRRSRLHDRLRFTLKETGEWTLVRVSP